MFKPFDYVSFGISSVFSFISALGVVYAETVAPKVVCGLLMLAFILYSVILIIMRFKENKENNTITCVSKHGVILQNMTTHYQHLLSKELLDHWVDRLLEFWYPHLNKSEMLLVLKDMRVIINEKVYKTTESGMHYRGLALAERKRVILNILPENENQNAHDIAESLFKEEVSHLFLYGCTHKWENNPDIHHEVFFKDLMLQNYDLDLAGV